jgi:hypothetical protein
LQLEELTAIAQDALSRVLPEAQTARVLEVLASLPELDDVASSLVPHLIAHA